MKLTMRPYQDEEDYWRIRSFLRQVTLANGLRDYSWSIFRFDYWRWHLIANRLEAYAIDAVTFIWETEGGEIAAVLNPEHMGEAFFQVHPAWRSTELEEGMLSVAEQRLRTVGADGRSHLRVWVDSQDSLRKELLTQRGYQPVGRPGEQEWQFRRDLSQPLPECPRLDGYTVRSLGDGLELLERCYASGLGFHNDNIHIARANRDDPTWYRNIQNAPLYRRDLDIVAVTADGAVASFCTIWFDDVNRTACFEPVATVPCHQRHGLGKAVMVEGLHRLKRIGAKVALVGGFSEGAIALYRSVMGSDVDISEPWEKEF
jgi:GNAT superfamily N-acetyltransferase